MTPMSPITAMSLITPINLDGFDLRRLAAPPIRGGRVRFRGFQSIPAFLA
jgi:hypothetical protein